MALVLAMQEQRSFYVDDTQVRVDEIQHVNRVKVTVVGKAMDNQFTLTNDHRTELLPGVFASVGLGSSQFMTKIAIEAPRKVRVLRDTLYHEGAGS